MRSEEVHLGSPLRRAEQERQIAERFYETWGEERIFCLYLPAGIDISTFPETFPLVLAAARQGHRVTILAHPAEVRKLTQTGFDGRHSHIRMVRLPRLLPLRGLKRAVEQHASRATLVRWRNDAPFPGQETAIPFTEFAQYIYSTERDSYGRKLDGIWQIESE